MANTKAPYGFRPIRYMSGAAWTGGGRQYYVPASYASNIFIGDPVVITGTGNASEFMGIGPGGYSTVQLGTAGPSNFWTGICTGIIPVTRDSTIYHQAGVEGLIVVEDDPNVIFSVQDDGFAALGVGAVGLNANGIAGAGNTASGRSGWALDAGTVTAPASNSLYNLFIIATSRGIGGSVVVGGDGTSAYAAWEVRLNRTTYAPAAGTGI